KTLRMKRDSFPLGVGLTTVRELDVGSRPLLLGDQPYDEVENRGEKDECLLDVHQDPAEVLVPHGGDPPETRRVRVEVIERRGGEGQPEPEKCRADERCSEVADLGGRSDVDRLVGEHGPPEDNAYGDEQQVLDVQGPRVLEREVVEERQVDRVPADET